LILDIVHRDLKLENILLKHIPTSKTDEFDIRVNFILKEIIFKFNIFEIKGYGFWIKFKKKYY
jgi:serine/threonine protein kinase